MSRFRVLVPLALAPFVSLAEDGPGRLHVRIVASNDDGVFTRIRGAALDEVGRIAFFAEQGQTSGIWVDEGGVIAPVAGTGEPTDYRVGLAQLDFTDGLSPQRPATADGRIAFVGGGEDATGVGYSGIFVYDVETESIVDYVADASDPRLDDGMLLFTRDEKPWLRTSGEDHAFPRVGDAVPGYSGKTFYEVTPVGGPLFIGLLFGDEEGSGLWSISTEGGAPFPLVVVGQAVEDRTLRKVDVLGRRHSGGLAVVSGDTRSVLLDLTLSEPEGESYPSEGTFLWDSSGLRQLRENSIPDHTVYALYRYGMAPGVPDLLANIVNGGMDSTGSSLFVGNLRENDGNQYPLAGEALWGSTEYRFIARVGDDVDDGRISAFTSYVPAGGRVFVGAYLGTTPGEAAGEGLFYAEGGAGPLQRIATTVSPLAMDGHALESLRGVVLTDWGQGRQTNALGQLVTIQGGALWVIGGPEVADPPTATLELVTDQAEVARTTSPQVKLVNGAVPLASFTCRLSSSGPVVFEALPDGCAEDEDDAAAVVCEGGALAAGATATLEIPFIPLAGGEQRLDVTGSISAASGPTVEGLAATKTQSVTVVPSIALEVALQEAAENVTVLAPKRDYTLAYTLANDSDLDVVAYDLNTTFEGPTLLSVHDPRNGGSDDGLPEGCSPTAADDGSLTLMQCAGSTGTIVAARSKKTWLAFDLDTPERGPYATPITIDTTGTFSLQYDVPGTLRHTSRSSSRAASSAPRTPTSRTGRASATTASLQTPTEGA